ncbi:LLM class flavin-dependent oxidoreductase [Helicobacter cappadocius]|uniref:Luciferase-like monooxygenase n=1 Tax=Helicobacter cappadocius TaxID=3063998 RepID=A0AA90PJX5_9HELI|nr:MULTISPECIES: LLM class flavin-dependent oxidoreductase [unclassified Helicobacter]MDO7252817.1 LLM class flavin-dependent oxidoreductase [Helicobacter sp. faydin-H75]MDP2538860.1 LLM class flavin-dependent oxidoreductase [Helicobacter sp. faydin-H76]
MSLNNIPFSFLDLVPVLHNGSIQEAFKNSLFMAKKAEELGFKRFWLAEHHNMDGIACSATPVLISYIASNTKTIRVGSGGIMLPNHTPLVVAEQFGTLQEIYGNRIDLGVGRARGGNYESALLVRKERMFSDENFFEEFQNLEDFLGNTETSKVKAIPGYNTKVPLYLLGSSLYSAQMAAKKGLPYAFASHFAPKYLLEALKLYRENFIPSEMLEKPYAIVALPSSLAPTQEEALFLASSSYQRALSLFRDGSLRLKPPVPFLDIDWNPNEKVSVLSLLSQMVIGEKSNAKKFLSSLLCNTQADEFIFTCDIYDQDKRIRSLELLAQVMQE